MNQGQGHQQRIQLGYPWVKRLPASSPSALPIQKWACPCEWSQKLPEQHAATNHTLPRSFRNDIQPGTTRYTEDVHAHSTHTCTPMHMHALPPCSRV
eukprot:114286-Chlamydomonas_euryale.AAC.6